MGASRTAQGLSPAAVVTLGTALVGLVALLDGLSGDQMSVAPFYLLIVLAVTWYGGAGPAWFVAALSAAALIGVGLSAGHPYSTPAFFYADVCGRLVAVVVTVLLASRLRSAFEHEQRNARLDALTGLPNRAQFDATLDLELARLQRFGRPFALVYIDCDNFKAVNDGEGHGAGDELLRTVAQTLVSALRKTDFSARLAGDEFGVLLPETDASTAGIVVDQMRERLLDAMRERRWPVTFSMGIAVFSRPVSGLSDALARADELMYRVKKRGKNGMLIETDGVRQPEHAAEEYAEA